MTFKDLLAAVRPILFEIDSEETPYCGQGTCFLGKSRARYSLFSARHALHPSSAEILRIFPTDESETSIAFNLATQVANPNPEDTDYSDVICLRVEEPVWGSVASTIMAFVDMDQPSPALEPGLKLIVAGYPDQFRSFDYVNFKIRATGQLLAAEYLARSISAACHEIRFTDLGEVSNLSGFSGSPVFTVDPSHQGAVLRFAGMLLRGVAESGVGHLLDPAVIRHFAASAARSNQQDPRGEQA